MKKLAVIATFITLLIIVIIILALKRPPPSHTLLRCDTEVTTRINANRGSAGAAVLQAKVHFFLYRNGTGFTRLNGSVEYEGKIYLLNRELWYSYHTTEDEDDDMDGNSIYILRFTSDLKHVGDSVPSKLWETFLQSEDDKVTYHVSIKRVNENLYLISTLLSPTLACRRY